MSFQRHHAALQRAIDELIQKHGSKHPELVPDLLSLRKQLQEAAAKNRLSQAAAIALQVATLVKFIRDWLP